MASSGSASHHLMAPSCCLLHFLLLLAAAHSAASAAAASSSAVYIVRLKGHEPLAAHPDGLYSHAGTSSHFLSPSSRAYSAFLSTVHDTVLEESLGGQHTNGNGGGAYEKLYSYTTLLNAFAVRLDDPIQVDSLGAHPRVASMEVDSRMAKATTYTPKFLGLLQGAWKARKGSIRNAGKGVVVGMLDTGIDPKHPSFYSAKPPPRQWRGKCTISPSFPLGSCNSKLVIARHFSKGIIAANAFNATYDIDSPLDGDGHGTHTSSIAVGNYGVPVVVSGFNYGLASGMAPGARLAVYKVVYRDGGYLSDVLAGVDQAIQDGVNVLSLSLGSTSSALGVPFFSTFDLALLFAVKAGAVVVHAAGNNGPSPMTMNSFGPWILSVGASTTDRSYVNPVILGNKQEFIGSGLSSGTPGKREYSMIYSKDAYITESTDTFDPEYYSYCPDAEAFNKTLVRGKILICNFLQLFTGGAGIEIDDAIVTAKKLGAVGLIIVSPEIAETSQQPKSTILDPRPYSLPTTFITDTDASLIIMDYYNQNTQRDESKKVTHFGATAWIKDSRIAVFKSVAPEVASYSSRGPVYANTASSMQSDILKPDILAPGSQIWGSWTPTGIDSVGFKGERFAMLSGTSMAAPHISGISALLIHAHRGWSNAAIRSAILTTASQFDNRGQYIHESQLSSNASTPNKLSSPFDYGSGFVNATAAMDPGLIFDVGFQDYVNFLCTVPGVDMNTVKEATGGICGAEAARNRGSDLNMPSITIGNLIGSRRVKRQVTSVSRHQERYQVEVHAPTGVQVVVEPMTFTIHNGEQQSFIVTLKTLKTSQSFTFGSLLWIGNKGHVVRMPLVVSATFMGA